MRVREWWQAPGADRDRLWIAITGTFGIASAQVARVRDSVVVRMQVPLSGRQRPVGSHGAGLVERLLLGSTGHALLYHAPCPVALIRPPTAHG
jgi:hypothetical protein